MSFDADDIILETCISAYRSFSSLKDTALFKSWIISIARNKCNDYFRQLAKNMELPIDEITGGHPPYGRMGVTAASPVKETLQKLGDKDKQVLYLYYFREFPQNEIARRLGIPIGTVKSRLHTAKSNFKKLYPQSCNCPVLLYENRQVKRTCLQTNIQFCTLSDIFFAFTDQDIASCQQ